MASEERENGPVVAPDRRLVRAEEVRQAVESDPAGRQTVPEVHARYAWPATIVRPANGIAIYNNGT